MNIFYRVEYIYMYEIIYFIKSIIERKEKGDKLSEEKYIKFINQDTKSQNKS